MWLQCSVTPQKEKGHPHLPGTSNKNYCPLISPACNGALRAQSTQLLMDNPAVPWGITRKPREASSAQPAWRLAHGRTRECKSPTSRRVQSYCQGGPVRVQRQSLSEEKAFRLSRHGLQQPSCVVILILVFILVFKIPLATKGLSEKEKMNRRFFSLF